MPLASAGECSCCAAVVCAGPLSCHLSAAGESGVDQLVEIIKVLGTPTKEEIHAMNPNYTEFKFPQIKAHPWTKVFSKRMPPDAIDLVSIVPCQAVLHGHMVCRGGRGVAVLLDLAVLC